MYMHYLIFLFYYISAHLNSMICSCSLYSFFLPFIYVYTKYDPEFLN